MKITDVHVHAVKGRHWPRFPMVFVEIETDTAGGLVGLGESLPYRSTGVLESLRELRDYLIGKDPFQIELHWETLYRHGANPAALSGIETALWDIVGKALQQPVYQLLGGAVRVTVDGSVIQLNGPAAVVWEMLAEALTPGELAEALAGKFGLAVTDIRSDIDAALAALSDAGVVEG